MTEFWNTKNTHTSTFSIDLSKISNNKYVSLLIEILGRHAPLKTKYISNKKAQRRIEIGFTGLGKPVKFPSSYGLV